MKDDTIEECLIIHSFAIELFNRNMCLTSCPVVAFLLLQQVLHDGNIFKSLETAL